MKRLFAALVMVVAASASTGCDKGFANEDCYVNSNYEIKCEPFDPGLQTP